MASSHWADPLPERRLARLLAAFISVGLTFLVLPGTLLGVWNLLNISSRRAPDAASSIWIQSHGHAQLFGWVATFILGISLYAVPKFRGGKLRSLPLAWAMFACWTAALALRWASAVWYWHWQVLWPATAVVELLVAVLLVWQCSAGGRNRRELWNILVFTGFAGLILVFAAQVAMVWRPLPLPLIPEHQDRLLLFWALWLFCFPTAWGFSVRFLPTFLGLNPPREGASYAALAVLIGGAVLEIPALVLVGVLAACWGLRIFEPGRKPAKTAGVHPAYPWFVRAAYAWLVISAALAAAGNSHGLVGASRHAFTVGFLAGLIFSIGPRILPSFLNSRELWSPRLMLWAMILLSAGCLLRVGSEPLAYAGVANAAWRVLPVSGMLELTAVLLFGWNIAMTLSSPMPAWIEPESVTENLELYWYVNAYPGTRRLLARAGLKMAARGSCIPRYMTLREAAEREGVDWRPVVVSLRGYFEQRLARTLKLKRR